MKPSFFLLLVIVVLPLISSCVFAPERIFADAKVRKLCKKDGGIKVYETVKLPAERFEKDGSIRIPIKKMAKPEDEYYYETSTDYLSREIPQFLRLHASVYRRSDNKLLGENIVYQRAGGGIPGPWHRMTYHCPPVQGGYEGYIIKQIFIKE